MPGQRHVGYACQRLCRPMRRRWCHMQPGNHNTQHGCIHGHGNSRGHTAAIATAVAAASMHVLRIGCNGVRHALKRCHQPLPARVRSLIVFVCKLTLAVATNGNKPIQQEVNEAFKQQHTTTVKGTMRCTRGLCYIRKRLSLKWFLAWCNKFPADRCKQWERNHPTSSQRDVRMKTPKNNTHGKTLRKK